MRASKLSLKNEQLHAFLKRMGEDVRPRKDLWILHLDSLVLNESLEERLNVDGQIRKFFTKSPTKTSPFHSAAFWNVVMLVLMD